MRWYWTRVGPKPNMIAVLIRGEDTQRQTQKKEGHFLMEAEDCWQPSERSKEWTSPRNFTRVPHLQAMHWYLPSHKISSSIRLRCIINALESSWNHPCQPHLSKNCLPQNQSLVPRSLGTTDLEWGRSDNVENPATQFKGFYDCFWFKVEKWGSCPSSKSPLLCPWRTDKLTNEQRGSKGVNNVQERTAGVEDQESPENKCPSITNNYFVNGYYFLGACIKQ